MQNLVASDGSQCDVRECLRPRLCNPFTRTCVTHSHARTRATEHCARPNASGQATVQRVKSVAQCMLQGSQGQRVCDATTHQAAALQVVRHSRPCCCRCVSRAVPNFHQLMQRRLERWVHRRGRRHLWRSTEQQQSRAGTSRRCRQRPARAALRGSRGLAAKLNQQHTCFRYGRHASSCCFVPHTRPAAISGVTPFSAAALSAVSA
jgi:hypothetical protein